MRPEAAAPCLHLPLCAHQQHQQQCVRARGSRCPNPAAGCAVVCTDACGYMPGCMVAGLSNGRGICVPKSLEKLSDTEASAYLRGIASFDAKLYGSCAAACWVNQVRAGGRMRCARWPTRLLPRQWHACCCLSRRASAPRPPTHHAPLVTSMPSACGVSAGQAGQLLVLAADSAGMP